MVNPLDIDIESTVWLGRSTYEAEYHWPATLCGLPLLGQGASKAVYALSAENVLKITNPYDPYSQLDSEIEVWLRAPQELACHLAEIIDFGQNWAIQERTRKVDRENPVTRKFAEMLTIGWGIRDLVNNLSNLGCRLTDNSLCAIDYAGGCAPVDWRRWPRHL